LIELESQRMKIRRSIKVLLGASAVLLLFALWNSKLCADLDRPKAINEQNIVGSWEGVVEARLKVVGLKVTSDKKAVLVISDTSSTKKYRSTSIMLLDGYLDIEFEDEDGTMAIGLLCTRRPFDPGGALVSQLGAVSQHGLMYEHNLTLFPVLNSDKSYYDRIWDQLGAVRKLINKE